MTPLARMVRDAAARIAGIYQEGPEPPARLLQVVDDFVRLRPTATRGEWRKFAVDLARGAYRDGYVRGFEWSERGNRSPETSDVEEAAARLAPPEEWDASEPVTDEEPELARAPRFDLVESSYFEDRVGRGPRR